MMPSKPKTVRGKPVGSRLIRGLTEFRDAVRDHADLPEMFTMRTVELDLRPHEYDAELVRSTREMLRVSQGVFAQLLGVTVDAVQAWEQGTRKPSKMACRFLDEIRHNPAHWLDRLREAVVPGRD